MRKLSAQKHDRLKYKLQYAYATRTQYIPHMQARANFLLILNVTKSVALHVLCISIY